jgi:hypothetical protein
MKQQPARHELAAVGTAGLALAARSCSLLKVHPQVLHRHPVIGVRAAFATFIREGLKDKASSPPHCKHKCLGKRPLFWDLRVTEPHPGQLPQGGVSDYSLQYLYVLGLQAFGAFDYVERHSLAFGEAAKATRLNGGEMDEYVLSTGTAQKAVAFRVVKPLHGSLFHWVLPCSFVYFLLRRLLATVRWRRRECPQVQPRMGQIKLSLIVMRCGGLAKGVFYSRSRLHPPNCLRW